MTQLIRMSREGQHTVVIQENFRYNLGLLECSQQIYILNNAILIPYYEVLFMWLGFLIIAFSFELWSQT